MRPVGLSAQYATSRSHTDDSPGQRPFPSPRTRTRRSRPGACVPTPETTVTPIVTCTVSGVIGHRRHGNRAAASPGHTTAHTTVTAPPTVPTPRSHPGHTRPGRRPAGRQRTHRPRCAPLERSRAARHDLAPRVSTGGAWPSPVRQVGRSRRHRHRHRHRHLAAPGHHTAVTVSVTVGPRRARGHPGQRDGRMAGWPGGRVAGWPGGRVAGWPGGRVAGWPGGRWPVAGGRVAGDRWPVNKGGHVATVWSRVAGEVATSFWPGGHERRAGGHACVPATNPDGCGDPPGAAVATTAGRVMAVATTWPSPRPQAVHGHRRGGWPGELATDCPAGHLVCRRGVGDLPRPVGVACPDRSPRSDGEVRSRDRPQTPWSALRRHRRPGGSSSPRPSAGSARDTARPDRVTGACRSPAAVHAPGPVATNVPGRCGAKGRQRSPGGHRAVVTSVVGGGHRHGRWPLASPGHRAAPVHRARVATPRWPWPPPTWPRGPACWPTASVPSSGHPRHRRPRSPTAEQRRTRSQPRFATTDRPGQEDADRCEAAAPRWDPVGHPRPSRATTAARYRPAPGSNHRPTGECQLPGRTAGWRGDVHRRARVPRVSAHTTRRQCDRAKTEQNGL